ncbi:DUF1439 domain-containing protein [Marinobacter salicampi]|uniref:DUF1439 domain-containing protein n=1 Tax=Marinobacter salicampi TaxID=435907 RepID=UPI0014072F3C|nr:DUF1439 domain-containing protein [Marinobacter salicampi]
MLRFLSLLVVVAFSLAGCASFSPYSISEGTLERNLQNVIENFDRQQLRAGSPLSVSMSDADITLGPDGRDVAVLDLAGQVSVNVLAARLPVDIVLKLEGAPVYDSEEKAVYLRRLKLLDSRIDSPMFSGDLKPITDNVMRVVAQMLETMPIYRLDDSDIRQRLFGVVPMDIRVAPGRLEFVTREN